MRSLAQPCSVQAGFNDVIDTEEMLLAHLAAPRGRDSALAAAP